MAKVETNTQPIMWTALQGEAHGYIMGDYGTPGALPPWLEARLEERVSVAAMADAMAMSERSFLRHFTDAAGLPPKAWLQQQRVARAIAAAPDFDLSGTLTQLLAHGALSSIHLPPRLSS